jgi:hypothetical protein
MQKYKWLTIFGLVLLSGCAQHTLPTPVLMPMQRVGGDRDAHGCIGSAGYVWCARETACVRSWELAAEKGLGQGAEAFQQYCQSH